MRSLVPLFVIAFLAASPVSAQTASSRPVPPKAPHKLTARAAGIAEASVRSHLEFLASDALNGRGSGTRDEWIAATYIASQLRRWGLEPLGDDGGYVQDVQIERSEIVTAPVLSFDGHQLTHGRDMVVSRLGGARLSGPLQKYRAGTPVAKGSVLLLPATNPPAPADTVPAAVVLTLEPEQARALRPSRPARALSIQHILGVPARATIALTPEAYDACAGTADGTMVTLDTGAGPPQMTHTWNAMGRLKGRVPADADDVILLTAHLDHLGNRGIAGAAPGADTIYNGADDDASGSVAVLELAESLAKGKRTKRSIIFAWFGSEEAGGYGAAHFIDAPPVPLARIVTNLEFEMIGRPDRAVPAHTLWLTGYERSNLGSELAKRDARIVADPHPDQNFFQRSDNIQLARRGVIAQTVSSFGLHTDYHRPSDEVKTIDFAHMTDAIRSMVAPVLWLANSSFRPEWVPGKKP